MIRGEDVMTRKMILLKVVLEIKIANAADKMPFCVGYIFFFFIQ